ncbi:MAG TPA: hypothetical protein VGI99_13110 [Gemmataceae bacterium]
MAEAKVKLCEMSRQRTDHRTPPGGAPRTGDRVTLSYETEHDKLPLWASEYMLVEVIQASAGNYRGRIPHDAFEPLLPPEKRFATGDEIGFTDKHIVEIAPTAEASK